MEDLGFENRFWLRILRDHMTFIINKLASKHVAEIQRATDLKTRLVQALTTVINSRIAASAQLIEELVARILEVRAFKILLLGFHVDPAVKIDIGLPPTFINHMLNELDEYLNILNRALGRPAEVPHILNVHKLWLSDAEGHAAGVLAELDPTEKKIKKEFKKEKKNFDMLKDKTAELIEYVNRLNTDFPAIQALNKEAINEITIFNKLLEELLSLRLNKLTLGTLAPLMINHFIREEAYALRKMGVNVGDLPLQDIPE